MSSSQQPSSPYSRSVDVNALLAQNQQLQQAVTTLEQENQMLSKQVKRLVITESELYNYQEQLDYQINLYKQLYEIGKQLNQLEQETEVFEATTQFVLYELGLERCLILMASPGSETYQVRTFDGYYEPDEIEDIQALTLDAAQPSLHSILSQGEFITCPIDCSNAALVALKPRLYMDEYVAIPLSSGSWSLGGLLIAGNTQKMLAYQTRVHSEHQSIVGLANLASHISNVLNNLSSYRALEQERQQLEDKVSQLVKTEIQLYKFQERLDGQVKIYRHLYEIGKQFNATFKLETILELVVNFVLYQLNYERCLVFLKDQAESSFRLQALDGYYDDTLTAAPHQITLSPQEHSLRSQFHQSNVEYLICPEDCTDPELSSLRKLLHLDEFIIFSLGSDKTDPIGLLIVGNTQSMAQYQTRITEDSEFTLGLTNLANQTSTAINTARIYSDLETYQQRLETKVSERTQELHEKNRFLENTLLELQQTQTKLIQSEKMSSIGHLVAGVAHEINNPVSFIYGNIEPAQGYADYLLSLLAQYQKHYPNPPDDIQALLSSEDLDFLVQDFPHLLASMKVGATRITEIVLSLRTFSRMDESEMKPVNIHDGLNSTLMLLNNRLKAQPDRPEIIVKRIYGELPLVECYAGQLNQVFMNLLCNAIDALESCLEPEPTFPWIEIETMADAENVTIIISDNGSGISEAAQKHLFDPFFTTKPVGKGTGLGLSISYQIVVEKHGGAFKCTSKLGEGTQFHLTIPLSQTQRTRQLTTPL